MEKPSQRQINETANLVRSFSGQTFQNDKYNLKIISTFKPQIINHESFDKKSVKKRAIDGKTGFKLPAIKHDLIQASSRGFVFQEIGILEIDTKKETTEPAFESEINFKIPNS